MCIRMCLDQVPSLHHMLGISLYNLHYLEEAAEAFKGSVERFNDHQSYLLLGDSWLHSQNNITGAAHAYLLAGMPGE